MNNRYYIYLTDTQGDPITTGSYRFNDQTGFPSFTHISDGYWYVQRDATVNGDIQVYNAETSTWQPIPFGTDITIIGIDVIDHLDGVQDNKHTIGQIANLQTEVNKISANQTNIGNLLTRMDGAEDNINNITDVLFPDWHSNLTPQVSASGKTGRSQFITLFYSFQNEEPALLEWFVGIRFYEIDGQTPHSSYIRYQTFGNSVMIQKPDLDEDVWSQDGKCKLRIQIQARSIDGVFSQQLNLHQNNTIISAFGEGSTEEIVDRIMKSEEISKAVVDKIIEKVEQHTSPTT